MTTFYEEKQQEKNQQKQLRERKKLQQTKEKPSNGIITNKIIIFFSFAFLFRTKEMYIGQKEIFFPRPRDVFTAHIQFNCTKLLLEERVYFLLPLALNTQNIYTHSYHVPVHIYISASNYM